LTIGAFCVTLAGVCADHLTFLGETLKKLLKTYWVELLILAALLAVGALLAIPVTRQALLDLARGDVNGVMNLVDGLVGSLKGLGARLTFEIVIGLLALAGILALVYWRLRFHLSRLTLWHGDVCPKCGAEVRRIHRRFPERWLGRLLGLHWRRYACNDPECGWTALRHGGPIHSRRGR
jgi:hypothetical protein